MSVIDKANEYVGHVQKMDEPYTDTIKRDAYADGYRDAIDKACEWLEDIDYVMQYQYSEDGCTFFNKDKFINDFRKAMED